MKILKLLVAFSMLLFGTANAATIEMTVNGLVCGFCAQGIEKTLRKNPATADVLVSLENRGGRDQRGFMLARAARLPCPTEPAAALACTRLRKISSVLFRTAAIAYVLGGGFVLVTTLI